MPYIGQRPATGEANSFKILDEISSFTLTFDGSSAGVVSVANDTITEREHRFVTGQRVTYNDGGGTAITGLSDGVYYVIVEDRHTFKLASSANNAAAGTAINLTGVGVGASHTLNVAFDGVNTKFKATINNGTRAGISQSGQLMLSINGVIQEPHDNTDSPSTGYAADHTSTIIFSAAPASTDQFFGRLIATNAPTFDISDNIVDNFTGDGSTSTFTLSKTPPNNESVLVTIDGVVQYPDDTSAVRAYTVAENILSFVSAPGLAVEIQVRHIGFAGASSAGITGFYGRTGNAVLKSTDNIVLNNATASGTVQAANVTVTGDLTVNGTTTTLDTDLIGVDKLEVAANNTTVAAAITQTGSGDILNLYDGATEVFSVADGGGVKIGGPGQLALDVSYDGSSATAAKIVTNTGITNANSTFTFAVNENSGAQMQLKGDGAVIFSEGSTERLRITSDGKVGIGTDNPVGKLEVATSVDGEATLATFKNTSGGGINETVDIKLGLQHNVASNVILRAGKEGNHSSSSSTDNFFAVHTTLSNTSSERLRIDSSGNVKIGSGAPGAKFHIEDANTTAYNAAATTAAASIYLVNTGTNGPLGIILQNASTDGSNTCQATISSVAEGTNKNTALTFGTRQNSDATIRERLRITSDGKLSLTGSAANMEYLRMGGNNDRGLRFTSSSGTSSVGVVHTINAPGDSGNQGAIVLQTNSTERLRITSDGSLQVKGDTNPNAVFDRGSANTTNVNFNYNGTLTGQLGAANQQFQISAAGASTPLVVYTNGSERLRIDSNGRLLKSGQAALTSTSLNHSIQVAAASDANAIAIIGRAADDIGELSFYEADKSTKLGELQYRQDHFNLRHRVGYISFATGGTTERLRITSGGYVNIGGNYTQTDYTAQVTRVGGNTDVMQVKGNVGNSFIRFTDTNASSDYSLGADDAISNGFVLYDRNASAYRVVVTSAGDVGIGDNAPNNNYGTNLSVHSTATDGARLKLSDGTTGKGNLDGLDIISTGGVAYFINRENADMSFSTNGSERLRITSGGNLGIGNARSAYPIDLQSTTSPLTLNLKLNKGSTTGDYAEIAFQLWSGAGTGANTFGGSGTSRPSVVLRAINEYTNSAAGSFVVATWPGGNDNAGLIERLRITSGGFVGINETAPGAQLTVKRANTATSGLLGVLKLKQGSATNGNRASLLFSSLDDFDVAAVNGVIETHSGTLSNNEGRLEFWTKHSGSDIAVRGRFDSEGSFFNFSTNHGIYTESSVGAGTVKYLYRGSNSSGSNIVFNVWSNGNVESATNSFGPVSDVKLKENIVDANSQWEDFKAVQFRKFNFKEESGYETHTQLGVIAQELEAISPGLVYETPDLDRDGNETGTTTKKVKASVLTMKALVALQEAITKIETLETQNADLLARVTALEGS